MRASVGVAAAVGIGLGMAGCQATSAPTAPSSSRSSQLGENFSSEARSLWQAYFAQYTSALANPQSQLTDLKPYLTDDEYDFIGHRIAAIRKENVRVVGNVHSRNFTVVNAEAMTALVCLDSSASRVLNAAGHDVTPEDRPETSTIRLVFTKSSGKLLLDRDESWTKSSVC